MIEMLTRPGVIAVLRLGSREQVLPVTEALLEGGVRAIEVTLTTPDAIAAIEDLNNRLGERALIGAGTVLTPTQCRTALACGAQFIVSPICRPEFSLITHAANAIMIMGAYTPTEAQIAYESEADYVKLFPAEKLGVDYIRALRGPLPHLKFIPTGGVDLDNIASFFEAGCPAVGIGSALVPRKLVEAGDWAALTQRAAEFVRAAQNSRRPAGD
ncbi:MAG: bifunctional 4-hydroxy-2-oxoglutarate aldolase/2-dehydro-3-deoxy-phosphogluconate aldolase [Verrucomicrobiae bacterium]|nr:bifunctional 4-hydroxy-2-oxoglutarate aldolase/2-dehydro-3-deoxy-phosphogluconate aldolase [Verrucomicrobiae bacterium]